MFIKAAFCIVLFAVCVGLCCYVTLEEWYKESKTRPYFCGAYCMTGCAFSLMVNAIGGLF